MIADRARRIPAAAWSSRRARGRPGCSKTLGIHAPTPPLKGQIVLLRSERPLLTPDRRARQELPRPARRRPGPGRRDRGGRRLRHPDDLGAASATCSTRRSGSARSWPRPRSSGPGPASGRGASTPGPTSAPPPAIATCRRHRPQTRGPAALAGHRRGHRRPRPRPAPPDRSDRVSHRSAADGGR